MREKAPTETHAAAALRELAGKVDAWRAQLRMTIDEVISLEASGATAISPDAASYDPDEAAHQLLNGHAYSPASIGTKPGVELFVKRRQIDELKRAIELADAHAADAAIDLGRELLQRHDPEIRALHRKRALLILQVFGV